MIAQEKVEYKLEGTSESLTGHAGLGLFYEAAQRLGMVESVRQHLPVPGSNRGYAPEQYVFPLLLMLCGGGKHLEDIREIQRDRGLVQLCGWKQIPTSDAIRLWLRRESSVPALEVVNQDLVGKVIAKSSLREFTLDVDATLIQSAKEGTQ